MERRLRRVPLRALAATLALAGAIILVPGCAGDEGPTDPLPAAGTYRVEVVSPAGQEGGAVLFLPAAGVTEVSELEGQLHTRETDDGIGVVLLRAEPGPLAFRLELDGEAPLPEVELLQVAGPDNTLPDLDGYAVETTRE